MWVLFLSVFAGCCMAWAYFKRGDLERSPVREKNIRSTAMIEPLLLPLYLPVFAVILLLFFRDSQPIMDRLTGLFLELLLVINVYYILLLCALPLLRRLFSPRACAALWILPNFLYLLANLYNVDNTSPRLVLTLPRPVLTPLGLIWLAGFILVLLGQILSHLRFRRRLLKRSRPAVGRELLSLWEAEQGRRDVKHPIPVLVSPLTHTPLTIGLFNKSQRLVLPHTDYTPEELELIFTHEARHIQRCDTRTKAFLGFCTAMGWFNPFLWISRRKVSDDLELSCDELVMHEADDAKRRQYANLLLNTAGGSRGYTTCLSAAASTMRYRLKHIVKPGKRLNGTVLVGLVLCALMLFGSTVALADSPGTVQTLIFDQVPEGGRIDHTYFRDGDFRCNAYQYEEAALTEYLASLSVRPVYAGNFSDFHRYQKIFEVGYVHEENGEAVGHTHIQLCGDVLYAFIPFDDAGQLTYVVDSEIDWDYIESLLDFDAPDPREPIPQPPEMMMIFHEDGIPIDTQPMYAERAVLSETRDGVSQVVSSYWRELEGVGGLFGAPATHAALNFSYGPAADLRILVENWDRTHSYTLSPEPGLSYYLELAPYSAHYTVFGTFTSTQNTVYEMEFVFDVGLPE